jgi:hypothetical protein
VSFLIKKSIIRFTLSRLRYCCEFNLVLTGCYYTQVKRIHSTPTHYLYKTNTYMACFQSHGHMCASSTTLLVECTAAVFTYHSLNR